MHTHTLTLTRTLTHTHTDLVRHFLFFFLYFTLTLVSRRGAALSNLHRVRETVCSNPGLEIDYVELVRLSFLGSLQPNI
jgi:hypothetical protein